jgi:anti-anti-sigma factor
MNINSEQLQGRVPVTIMRLSGDVDGSNYQTVIQAARDIHQQGARDLLLDLSGVGYTSSAGLVALLSTARLFNDQEMPNPDEGWSSIRMVGDARDAGFQTHVKLLNPQPRVSGILEQTGLNAHFQVFTDQAAAVASF